MKRNIKDTISYTDVVKMQNTQSKHSSRHKSHHHSSKKNTQKSIFDIWTIVPLVLSFLLTILSGALYIKTNKKTPFCSENASFDKCIPCPSEAVCRDGIATCRSGYKLSGRTCVSSAESSAQALKLALKMGKFIADQVNEFCNASILVSYDDLHRVFGNDPLFSDALNRISSSDHEIHVVGDSYISLNPSLDMRCRCYNFVYENILSLTLLTLSLLFVLYIIIKIQLRKRTKRQIKEYALDIIDTLKNDKKGKLHPVESFEPLETDKLYPYWEEIIDEVESNKCITVYNSVEGKQWKYQP